MVEGRRRWVEYMNAEGKKFPCGRKSGPDWITPKMREQIAFEEQARAPMRPSNEMPRY